VYSCYNPTLHGVVTFYPYCYQIRYTGRRCTGRSQEAVVILTLIWFGGPLFNSFRAMFVCCSLFPFIIRLPLAPTAIKPVSNYFLSSERFLGTFFFVKMSSSTFCHAVFLYMYVVSLHCHILNTYFAIIFDRSVSSPSLKNIKRSSKKTLDVVLI
jgi:hypothetical protein